MIIFTEIVMGDDYSNTSNLVAPNECPSTGLQKLQGPTGDGAPSGLGKSKRSYKNQNR